MKNKPNKIFLSAYNTINIPSGFELVLVTDFDKIKDNSIDELFIKDIIGLYSDANIVDFLNEVIQKIKPNGILHIQDIDIEQFSVYIANKILPITDKKLICNRNNIFYMRYLVKIIQDMGILQINQLNFINGYEFYIMIEKHAN